MDWHHALGSSVRWLLEVFVVSSLVTAVLIVFLARMTSWGRQFCRITGDYFDPRRHRAPLLMLALMVFMTLFSVRMNLLFSFWYNGIYTAMQTLEAKAFWAMMMVFGVLAFIHVVRSLLFFYIQQAFALKWRIWLTDQMTERWLKQQAYFRSQYIDNKVVDNPDQRIQQDVHSFVFTSLTLSLGLLSAVVSLFAFTIVLWGLSGTLTLMGVAIPRAMVFLVYVYVIVATVFAIKLGRPFIALNFLSEKFNASFRYALIRLREYGESVAFFRGEAVERAQLRQRFSEIVQNTWDLIFRSLKFQGFNLGISQIAVVFPMIVQAPRLLSKQITLGDMMQTSQAFNQVQEALSFIRTSYDDFASYRAVLLRLVGFLDVTDAAYALKRVDLVETEHVLTMKDLTVVTPEGRLLVDRLNATLTAPASLLIQGPSGIGKTTLLRALAGLWPYVEGTVERPLAPKALFLSQKPYLPLGSLRAALTYPALVDETDPAAAERAKQVLCQCQLAHWAPRLDDTEDWPRILSLGEQQRLAIGRVLLSQPQLVFLDEATSAMDEGLEYAMYQLLHDSLGDALIVSVGHRPSLLSFHAQRLSLSGEGKWEVREGQT